MNRWQRACGCALLMIGAMLIFPRAFFYPKIGGLDGSWQIAVNLAFQDRWLFGRDVIFTYGPLSVLLTRLPFPGMKLLLIVFDALLYLNVLVLLLYAAAHLRSLSEFGVAFLILFCFRLPLHSFEAPILVFALMNFYLLWYKSSSSSLNLSEHRPWWMLIIAGFLSITAFFMKMHFGLAAVAVYLSICLLEALSAPKRMPLFLLMSGYLLVLVTSAAALNVYLPGYILGGWEVSNSYSDAMFIPAEEHSLCMAVLILFAYVLSLVCSYQTILSRGADLFGVLLTTPLIFLLFKQGFVRADGHTLAFFQLVPSVLGILYLFSRLQFRWNLARVLLLSLLFSFSTAASHFKLSELTQAPGRLSTYRDTARLEIARTPDGLLPARWPQVIGEHSVDIFPWDVSSLYLANLNYKPRPGLQSFAAYNHYLDTRNHQSFMSSSAPRYVIFSNRSIDQRYPFFDESLTKLALLRGYRVIDSEEDWLLLERRSEQLLVRESDHRVGTGRLGETIDISQGPGLQFISFNIKYSFRGMLVRFLYQPPPLGVRFDLEDGESRDWRAIKPILAGGVVVNRCIQTTSDARLFFEQQWERIKGVKAITFYTSAPWAYRREFQYTSRTVGATTEQSEAPPN